ncbi:GNAT family N-acetyltransferase [Flagellimonas sp. CMM7]|uniref:GNAT family N-acetyltransferase n=1 Tax=Flagellimonas sp. CMM7 TaxID=2654676 RepID=UPI0013D45466|nr:GNAT family N-acetyltransferase [Flagellimonas sp. CMM7]UII81566.1 GNAT family N-acetyltransferase [Flagellimonas sp. CMM7]
MEIRIISKTETFSKLKEEWHSLEKTSSEMTVYCTFDYLYTWWKEIGINKGIRLCIICIYENSKIIGIAPLMIETKRIFGIRLKILKFLANADFHNFLLNKELGEQRIIRRVFDAIYSIEWDKLELSHISNKTSLTHFLLKSEQYNKKVEFLGENPILFLKNYDSFLIYKQLFFKKKINNYRNRLKKDFNVVFEVIKGDEKDILSKISKVHIERNQDGNKRKSLFEDTCRYNFVKEFYKECNRAMTFLIKTDDGTIVSYATCYSYYDTIYNWNTAFNPKFQKYSAGDLIYYEMINFFFEKESEIKKLDFGAGGYPWKFRMTNTFETTYKLNLNNKNFKKHHFLEIYDKVFKMGKIVLNKK